MTPFTKHGVPYRLHQDAWWLAADTQSGVGTATPQEPRKPLVLGLIAAVVLADLMLWQAHAGLGFVILILALAGLVQWMSPLRANIVPWVILLASIIPAIDLVQTLSVGLALLGLSTFALMTIGADQQKLPRAMLRLPIAAIASNIEGMASIFHSRPAMPDKGQFLRDWLMPLSLGAMFFCLMILANPVVENLIANALAMKGFDVDVGRVTFWVIALLAVWPLLRLQQQTKMLFAHAHAYPSRSGVLMNPRSLARALILFNALFALQTIMDFTYLLGGVALPDGMTYATYAHRGAYPLLATALLAGGFAIVAQPMLGAGSALRWLLLVWVGQTVLLVATSILRLDLYVSAYGLTVFRVAAFTWMGLVAIGLCLLMWQVVKRHPISWLMLRAGALGLGVLYVASLINISGLVAHHNLNRTVGTLDTYYLCNMGQGASPAIIAYNQMNPAPICTFRDNSITPPQDLREWGYRQHRLRSNVATMMETAQ